MWGSLEALFFCIISFLIKFWKIWKRFLLIHMFLILFIILPSFGTHMMKNKFSLLLSQVREQFPLTPMGVLAPRSVHARPSVWPPINMRRN